jgi:hypothetical protein
MAPESLARRSLGGMSKTGSSPRSRSKGRHSLGGEMSNGHAIVHSISPVSIDFDESMGMAAFAPKYRVTPRTPPAFVQKDEVKESSRSRSRSGIRSIDTLGSDFVPSTLSFGENKERDESSSSFHAVHNEVTSKSVPMSLTTSKCVLQAILTALNVACWWFPLQSERFSSNTATLSVASCFSGGVFLTLSLTHLLPHSMSVLEKLGKSASDKADLRKSACVWCMVGYALVLWLEKVAFSGVHPDAHATETGSAAPGSSSDAHSAKVVLLAMSVHSMLEMLALGYVVCNHANA